MGVFTLLVTAACAFGATTSAAATVNSTKTCTTLADKNAPLYTALSLLNMGGSGDNGMAVDSMLAPVDAALPWLSKCVGSGDILAIGMTALSDPSLSKCLNLVSSLESSASGDGKDEGLGSVASLSLNGNIFGSSLCPLLSSTLMPCLDTIYTKTLPALIISGGSCCDDMQAKMEEFLGTEWEEVLKSLTRRTGDVVCAVKSYRNASSGATTNETCVDAWIKALGSGPFMDDIFKMAQTPNDQACAAMEGETFTTTSGEQYQLFKNQTPIDSCFAPMNLLLTDMSKLPMIAAMNMTDMFADGKCLKGQSVIDWAKDPNGSVLQLANSVDGMIKNTMPNLVSNATSSNTSAGDITAEVDSGITELEEELAGVCLHLPNSVASCKYKSSIQFAFFTDASQQFASNDNAETPKASASTASASTFSVQSTIVAFALAFVGIYEA
uniref:Uncharacterized protein n=1 Tax=Globisporangium ultimum (strain ATCC 200006 / CBS 805.95 / DAOM BR144) TaxID=431595 RepID=K3WX92_GLOUD